MNPAELQGHYSTALRHLDTVRARADWHNRATARQPQLLRTEVENVIGMVGPLLDAVIELSACVAGLIEREPKL